MAFWTIRNIECFKIQVCVNIDKMFRIIEAIRANQMFFNSICYLTLNKLSFAL